MKTTITEALAELKTLQKRVVKKREFVAGYLARDERVVDPLKGGSDQAIAAELQSIDDLERRLVNIRVAIQKANQGISLTIGGQTYTVAEWLTWRKEVAPAKGQFYNTVRTLIDRARKEAQQKGLQVATAGSTTAIDSIPRLVINVDEKNLAANIEAHEVVLGTLDGQLSLLNATVLIDIP